jgi:hypothetical protein
MKARVYGSSSKEDAMKLVDSFVKRNATFARLIETPEMTSFQYNGATIRRWGNRYDFAVVED